MKRFISVLLSMCMAMSTTVVRAIKSDIEVWAQREFIELTYPYEMPQAVVKLYDEEGNEIVISREEQGEKTDIFVPESKLDVDKAYMITAEESGVSYTKFFCLEKLLYDDFDSYSNSEELRENWIITGGDNHPLELVDGKMSLPALTNAAAERFVVSHKDKANQNWTDYTVEYDFERRSGYSSNQHFYTLLREKAPDNAIQVSGQGATGIGVTISNQFLFNDGGTFKTSGSQYDLSLNGESATTNVLVAQYQNNGAVFHIKAAVHGDYFTASYDCAKNSESEYADRYDISYKIPADSDSQKSGYFKLASRAMGGYVDNFLVYRYSENMKNISEITDKMLLNIIKNGTAENAMNAIEKNASKIGIDLSGRYEKITDKQSVYLNIAGKSFSDTDSLAESVCSEINRVYFAQFAAYDEFTYENGTKLNSTVRENGFSGGYMADEALSGVLSDNCVINDGVITGAKEIFRGTEIQLEDDEFIAASIRINNNISDNESVQFGISGTYMGIKKSDGEMYAVFEDSENPIDDSQNYDLYIIYSASGAKGIITWNGGMYEADLTLKGSFNNVVGIISAADDISVSNLQVQVYDSKFSDNAYSAFYKLKKLIDDSESKDVIVQAYEEYRNECDKLYDGNVKDMLLGMSQDERIADIIKEYSIKQADEILTSAEEKALYSEYLYAEKIVNSLEDSEEKTLLINRLEELKKIIDGKTPRILFCKVEGENTVGETLTAQYVQYDECGNGVECEIIWYADGKEISRGSTLELTQELYRSMVKATAVPENNAGVQGEAKESDEVYIYDYAGAVNAVNSAGIYEMEEVLDYYALELAFEDNEKVKYITDKNDIYTQLVNRNFADVDEIRASYKAAIDYIVQETVIPPSRNVSFRYADNTNPITEEVNMSPPKLYCDFNARRYSIIGFDLGDMLSDGIVKAEFGIKEDYTEDRSRLGGQIKIRELGELERAWAVQDAKTFLDACDINGQNSSTTDIGIFDVKDGSKAYTTADITDLISNGLSGGRKIYNFSYLDLAAKNVMFWSMSSADNTPRIVIWRNLSKTVVDKVNAAELNNLEAVLREYQDYIGIDFSMDFSMMSDSEKETVLKALADNEFESVYEIKKAFDNAVSNILIEFAQSENAFDLNKGDKLNLTGKIHGFASGWTANAFGSKLSDEYYIDDQGYIHTPDPLEIYRLLSKRIIPDSGECYISTKIHINGNMNTGDYVGFGADDNICGVSKREDGIHIFAAPGYSFKYGEVLPEKGEYNMIMRIDDKMNIGVAFQDENTSAVVEKEGFSAENVFYALALSANTSAQITYSDLFVQYHAVGASEAYTYLNKFISALENGTDKEKYYAARELKDAKDKGIKGLANDYYTIIEKPYLQKLTYWLEHSEFLSAGELVEYAEKTVKYEDYKKAADAVEKLPQGEEKTELETRIKKLKLKIDEILPSVTVKIVGQNSVGSVLKGEIEVTDECGNGAEPIKKWYVNNNYISSGDTFTILSSYEGSTIYLEAIPRNTSGKTGTAVRSIGINIPKNTSGGGSSGGGGGGASSGGQTAYTPPKETQKPDIIEDSFSDIENHWAKDAINALAKKGTINGRDDNRFCPDENITRAEFTAIISRILKLNVTTGKINFKDVSENDWYYEAIAAAYENGVVSGDGDEFRPQDNITRQEMAMIMASICKMNGIDAANSAEIDFADKDSVSDWADEAVRLTVALELFNGNDKNEFLPLKNATRAEAASVIYRFIGMME